MTFGRAVGYFLREAALNLLRSWKVSFLAVATMAVSLAVGGTFLLLGGNLAEWIERWQSEAKVVVYLAREAGEAETAELVRRAGEPPWVRGVDRVSPEEAARRFRDLFPNLADLVDAGAGAPEGGGEGGVEAPPLPPSLELTYDPRAAGGAAFAAWLEALRASPAAEAVDDDRDWLDRLVALVGVAQGVGLLLGGILLAAAVFTIASIIRLTAYLYHEEIGIMRLVGATEFFIRGPFYVEGLLQGLAGGLLAVLLLRGGYAFAHARAPGTGTSWADLLLARFLTPRQILLLVLLGAIAGLTGAAVSLRRETLGATMEG